MPLLLAIALPAQSTPAAEPTPKRIGQVLKELPAPACCAMGITWDGSALWVADRKVNKLFKLDPNTGRVLAELPTPGLRPTGLTWDGSYLWVADRDRDELFRLNPSSGVVDRVYKTPLKAPRGLAWDGECLWVAEARTDTLYCLDPDDGTVSRTLPAPSGATTGMTFDGKYLWVADRGADELYKIDPKRGHVVGILPSPGPHPYGLAWDGKRLWVGDYQQRKLARLNVTQGPALLASEQKKLRVEYTVHFFSQGPDPVQTADIYIALPENRYHQSIQNGPRFTPEPDAIVEDNWGQKLAHFHRRNLAAGSYSEYAMAVDSTLTRTRFWIDPDKVKSYGTIDRRMRDQYLSNSSKYHLDSPIVVEAAREAVAGETHPYWMARNIYQYVLGKLDYSREGGWDPVPLLLSRSTGSCSEYSFVLIALCRAAGIPARYVAGIVTRGDDAFVDNVFHRWVEIYLPGYGWIPVDADRGDKPTPRGQAMGFGGIDNTLLVTTVAGGESNLLGWRYNSNTLWTFTGRTRVYVEQIGELAPIGNEGE
ncbi:MAG: transglutaminase domain-containing protein [Pseudomonadota bacterium]